MITSIALSPAADKIFYIDGFKPGGLYRVRNVLKTAGGKGVNVARVLSTIGEKVTVAGFKAGQTGDWIESQLKDTGMCTAFTAVDGETRTNNNIIDAVNKTETEVLEIGPIISGNDTDRFLADYESILNRTDVLVCSGGLPEGIRVDFYRTLIELAVPYGIKVILDTNGEMLKEGIKAGPYMVKPNLRELCQYAGMRLDTLNDTVSVCRSVISEGVSAVTVSMGKEGALMVLRDTVMHARPPDVYAVNSIGSGDSMVAGLAAGLSRRYGMEDTFRLGMACAVANTQFPGIGFVENEMVDRYYNMIIIEKGYDNGTLHEQGNIQE